MTGNDTTQHTPEGNQLYFYHWITEREKCRHGRENNLPKPWSSDEILQSYRFCNVQRENDKVTRWLDQNWRQPFAHHPNLTYAMCLARLFNRIETLEFIRFPEVPPSMYGMWLERQRHNLKQYRGEGNKVFTGAYLVSTNGHSMDKIDYILDKVLSPIWFRLRKPIAGETLESYHAELMRFDGMGSFMAGQVIADLKYTPLLKNAPDWNAWAPVGPGSRRGLNRYFGRKLEGAIATKQLLREIALLQNTVQQRCGLALPAHDVQNCLCEYDKYLRIRLGEGRPRSTYSGKL